MTCMFVVTWGFRLTQMRKFDIGDFVTSSHLMMVIDGDDGNDNDDVDDDDGYDGDLRI